MSWHWKELLPVDRYTVRTADYLNDLDQKVVTLLYQPLIGTMAYGLYLTLWSELERDEYWSKEQTHRHLMLMMGVTLENIYQERKKLEAIGLLRTYKRKDQETTSYLYELQPPMSPQQFFENDVLSVYIYNRLGKSQYLALRDRFMVDVVDKNEYVETTYSFDEVYTSLHHSEIVSNHQSEMGEALSMSEKQELLYKRGEDELSFAKSSFDFELMKNDLSSYIVPENVLTEEVKQTILRLAFVYRIEPLQMSRILQQALIHDDEVDIGELRKRAQEWYKLEHGNEPPTLAMQTQPVKHRTMVKKEAQTEEEKVVALYETTSPLTLLESRSDGAKVPLADVKIIENLLIDYQLLPGVVNVLLDYVLMRNNMKLSKSLIEKIAGHWARKKVKTVVEAMKLAKEEYNQSEERKKQIEQGKHLGRPPANGRRKNTRRDTLPKWLLNEQANLEQNQNVAAKKETTKSFDEEKREFERLMEERKLRMQRKGED
ncbi:replication initiation and membrane attachment family protein [Halalkalibacterium ligniniphilum]|uniref:replication initiation and membrane attachment family protein n=1 Tax=Halalkalibacterium ligniniphilum TaxID=1134413 RepID=UPI0003484256|nr:replication initiation and membrane attachment family protein [Halalkalibacterium ligniniphilum]